MREQTELDDNQQGELLAPLKKHEMLFDGQLGHWKDQEAKLDLQEGAKPYHACACNMPRCHLETLKAEVSQWAAPTFIMHKKDGSV